MDTHSCSITGLGQLILQAYFPYLEDQFEFFWCCKNDNHSLLCKCSYQVFRSLGLQPLMCLAGGLPAQHWKPIRLSCGSNHSILYGRVLGFFASLSLCQAVHVRLMAAPMDSLLDGGVDEILIRGSPV